MIDYTRKNIFKQYATLEKFLQKWSTADKKQALIDALVKEGIFLELLRDTYKFSDDVDDFDLILHIAYDKKILTRQRRAAFAKSNAALKSYPEKCRAVLNALLDKYADNGIADLENLLVLKNYPFVNFGTPQDIANLFGGRDEYLKAVAQLKNLIYQAA